MVPNHQLIQLRKAISDDMVLPFIGSGLSTGAGLPNWYELVSHLAEDIAYQFPPPQWATADTLIEAVQAFVNERGVQSLISYLKESLDTTHVAPTAAHIALAQLPCSIFFTTNYDDLLEQAFRAAGKRVRLVVRDNDLAFMAQSSGIVNIIKLYGDLTQPETIVLARQQYERFFLDRPQMLKLLEVELSRKTMLYIGFGHRDPHFGLILGEILTRFGDYMRTGYMLGSGIDLAQIVEMRRKRIETIDLGREGDRTQRIAEWLGSLQTHLDTSSVPLGSSQTIVSGSLAQPARSGLTGGNPSAKVDLQLNDNITTSIYMENRAVKATDIDQLVGIISRYVSAQPISPQIVFRDLISRADLPPTWPMQLAGTWTGNIQIDARNLIKWAISKGTNPQDTKMTTLGSILTPLLREVGFDDASTIVAVIRIFQLYRNDELIEKLTVRFQVPLPADQIGSVLEQSTDPQKPQSELGPTIDWHGPTSDLELQSWLKPLPDFLDVELLKRAIKCATSVCRIDIPSQRRTGTGFLIASNLVLTNYHLLNQSGNEDISANANNLTLHFGYFTSEEHTGAEGQIFKLSGDQPILASSDTTHLDFVLLKVEDRITQAEQLRPIEYEVSAPGQHTELSILQHPYGETMKLAISSNAIVGVFPGSGKLQYITRTAQGSSGAPCFNSEWKVVAMHRAERARSFGNIREGILFGSIYGRIKDHLV